MLLYFPYPRSEQLEPQPLEDGEVRDVWQRWYQASMWPNHENFTNMIRFAMSDVPLDAELDILDYGGGGGQFATVVSSHFPAATTWLTDIDDHGLQPEWRDFNRQILFDQFPDHPQRYDAIFLNDVFEHVEEPVEVLELLKSKLKPEGRIFIDTPKTFWLYPLLRLVAPSLYQKLCQGSVSIRHLQVWSRKSFYECVSKAGLEVKEFKVVSEFTREPEYYLDNMELRHWLLRWAGQIVFRAGPLLARNKIMSVLVFR